MYPILLALLSAMLFGASTPVGKLLLESLPPFQLAGWLYLGAAVGVVPSLLYKPADLLNVRRIGSGNVMRLCGAIGFGGVAGPVLLLMGLQRSPAASVSLWLNLELVATVLLGSLIFRDHLGKLGWIGVGGTITASVMLSWQSGHIGLVGFVLVAGACICWGLDNHLTALIDDITPTQSTFWKGLVAGGVNLAIGISTSDQAPTAAMAVSAMAVGAVAYGASITLYIKSAHYLGATRSQMIFSAAPFFGVALAVPLLGEDLGSIQVLAAGLLILSLVLLFRDRHHHSHRHERLTHLHEHDHQDPHHGHSHPSNKSAAAHNHSHQHHPMVHAHPHWPDIHHRHKHREE